MSIATQPLALPRCGARALARDYAELIKLRVTTLIVMTAWAGFYFGAIRSGVSSLSWSLLHALLGIGMVSAGTAALNEALEHDIDARMRRTSIRPIPMGRMTVKHGAIVGGMLAVGGALYLALALNPLTGLLASATSLVYLAAYTPLKKIHPICTFVGAFPGAMPGVLGWTAARGRLEWPALVLFAIVFFWQFPHFFSIAWLYREDYEAGHIRMLPVVEPDSRSTARQILFYSMGLIPVSLLPFFLGMAGRVYLVGAFLLGMALLYFSLRLVASRVGAAAPGCPAEQGSAQNSPYQGIASAMPQPSVTTAPLGAAVPRLLTHPNAPRSKPLARNLLQATVFYLPLLFALMMWNALGA
jgi:protoheme IX farnesyltransferase